MIDTSHIERQLEQARKLEADLVEEMKPYLWHWRLASRIKRKLGKVRKARLGLEERLIQARNSVGE